VFVQTVIIIIVLSRRKQDAYIQVTLSTIVMDSGVFIASVIGMVISIYIASLMIMHRGVYFWYSGYGGETDVSLNCGRFYGPTRPRMRMKE
jgi:hypothetical protein